MSGKPATRERILDAAHELMLTIGLARATTKEIAKAAGCSEAALYKHFASKEELFISVLSERLPRLGPLLEGLAAEPGRGSVEDNLTEIARQAARFYEQSFPIAASLYAEAQLKRRHDDAMREMGTGPHLPIEGLDRYLRAERAAGRLRPDADTFAAASLLLGPVRSGPSPTTRVRAACPRWTTSPAARPEPSSPASPRGAARPCVSIRQSSANPALALRPGRCAARRDRVASPRGVPQRPPVPPHRHDCRGWADGAPAAGRAAVRGLAAFVLASRGVAQPGVGGVPPAPTRAAPAARLPAAGRVPVRPQRHDCPRLGGCPCGLSGTTARGWAGARAAPAA